MSLTDIGKSERITQNRIIQLFQKELHYDYLGNWEEEMRTQPIEEGLLFRFLTQSQGYSDTLARKAVDKLVNAAGNIHNGLYEVNKQTYHMLRYGVSITEEAGQLSEQVWFINWSEPHNNHFAVAEEVTVKGKFDKRPDIVLYVNGIALGVLELKRSKVGVTEGIRQNLDNQKPEFIQNILPPCSLYWLVTIRRDYDMVLLKPAKSIICNGRKNVIKHTNTCWINIWYSSVKKTACWNSFMILWCLIRVSKSFVGLISILVLKPLKAESEADKGYHLAYTRKRQKPYNGMAYKVDTGTHQRCQSTHHN